MDRSFVDNVQNKQVIAVSKQIRTALADKVLEALANKKVAMANEMGLKEAKKAKKAKKEDVNVGGSGNPKVGEPADSQDGRTADEKKYLIPEKKK